MPTAHGPDGPPGDLVIRRAAPEDAGAVASLCGELGYPITTARALEHISDGRGVELLVAEHPGSGVVGWIELAIRRTVEFGDAAEIQGLVVRAERRGRAVGSALLAAAERWARDRGMPRIRVRSNVVRDRTHGFYRDRGYVERKRQVVFDKMLDDRASS